MKKVYTWFLPDYDTHFEKWMVDMREETYQRKVRQYALQQVKNFSRAIDIGGNVGFWSRDFCEKFEKVEIFEPDKSNLECLKENLKPHTNHTIHEVGLGAAKTKSNFFISPTASGGHSIYRNNVPEDTVTETMIDVHTLDQYKFEDVGLIKIDTQGSELDVLKGATETLKRESPILNIEIELKTKEQVKQGNIIKSHLKNVGYSVLGWKRRTEVVFAKV